MAGRVLDDAPDSFALAGHSMGGRVALEIVRRAPERVERLALLCTDYRGHASEESRRQEALERERLLAMARDEGMRTLARFWFAGLVAPARTSDTALMAALETMGARHTPRQLAAEINAGLTRGDYADLLPTIACPTLVCAGAEDRLRPAERHVEMAAEIPRATLVLISGSGHMAPMENPAAVSAALRRWLGVP
jgi:pimeloyl-ACP methyl ester carboxylesterase